MHCAQENNTITIQVLRSNWDICVDTCQPDGALLDGELSATRVRRKSVKCHGGKTDIWDLGCYSGRWAVTSRLLQSSSQQTKDLSVKHNVKDTNGVFCVDIIMLQLAMATEKYQG